MRILKYAGYFLIMLVVIVVAVLYKGDLEKEVVDAKYSSEQSRFLELASGASVHYRDEGNPAGAPLVLIHGSNASLHTWEPWVARLGDDYRIVTLDLPGHGLTGRTPDDDYSSAAFISTIDAIVTHLEIDNFALGGNSMGGGATWRYALAYPDKVNAMILIDASGPPQWRREPDTEAEVDSDADNGRPIAFTLLSKSWFRSIARSLDPYWLTAQGVRAAYNNSPVVDQALIDRYYELSIREGTRDATMARFASFGRNMDETIDLSVLTQPTLIMWGAEDGVIAASVADKFEATLPNSQKVIYENVGHIPMEEVPEISANDVRDFLLSL
jgi:pimeloyl-ACP methyl ester carboxylesterase